MLTHSHLQPYILKIHMNSNNPRRNTFPFQWSDSNYIKKTRFMEPEVVPMSSYREKRRSFSNDRTLNPSISGTEQDSPCSTQKMQEFSSHLNRKFSELSVGSAHEEIGIDKSVVTKFSSATKTPRSTPWKASATPRRQTDTLKVPRRIGSNHDSVSCS